MNKSMEDNVVHADGTVRVADGGVVAFRYGSDGLDPAKLERARLALLAEPEARVRARMTEEEAALALACRDDVRAVKTHVLAGEFDARVLLPFHPERVRRRRAPRAEQARRRARAERGRAADPRGRRRRRDARALRARARVRRARLPRRRRRRPRRAVRLGASPAWRRRARRPVRRARGPRRARRRRARRVGRLPGRAEHRRARDAAHAQLVPHGRRRGQERHARHPAPQGAARRHAQPEDAVHDAALPRAVRALGAVRQLRGRHARAHAARRHRRQLRARRRVGARSRRRRVALPRGGDAHGRRSTRARLAPLRAPRALADGDARAPASRRRCCAASSPRASPTAPPCSRRRRNAREWVLRALPPRRRHVRQGRAERRPGGRSCATAPSTACSSASSSAAHPGLGRGADAAEERDGERVVHAYGNVLVDCAAAAECVDWTRCTSNDVWEVYHALGIEACVHVFFEQVKAVVSDGTYVDDRHLLLICDNVCRNGTACRSTATASTAPTRRRSCAAPGRGDLRRAVRRGGVRRGDATARGVEGGVMTGQVADVGTGAVHARSFRRRRDARRPRRWGGERGDAVRAAALAYRTTRSDELDAPACRAIARRATKPRCSSTSSTTCVPLPSAASRRRTIRRCSACARASAPSRRPPSDPCREARRMPWVASLGFVRPPVARVPLYRLAVPTLVSLYASPRGMIANSAHSLARRCGDGALHRQMRTAARAVLRDWTSAGTPARGSAAQAARRGDAGPTRAARRCWRSSTEQEGRTRAGKTAASTGGRPGGDRRHGRHGRATNDESVRVRTQATAQHHGEQCQAGPLGRSRGPRRSGRSAARLRARPCASNETQRPHGDESPTGARTARAFARTSLGTRMSVSFGRHSHPPTDATPTAATATVAAPATAAAARHRHRHRHRRQALRLASDGARDGRVALASAWPRGRRAPPQPDRDEARDAAVVAHGRRRCSTRAGSPSTRSPPSSTTTMANVSLSAAGGGGGTARRTSTYHRAALHCRWRRAPPSGRRRSSSCTPRAPTRACAATAVPHRSHVHAFLHAMRTDESAVRWLMETQDALMGDESDDLLPELPELPELSPAGAAGLPPPATRDGRRRCRRCRRTVVVCALANGSASCAAFCCSLGTVRVYGTPATKRCWCVDKTANEPGGRRRPAARTRTRPPHAVHFSPSPRIMRASTPRPRTAARAHAQADKRECDICCDARPRVRGAPRPVRACRACTAAPAVGRRARRAARVHGLRARLGARRGHRSTPDTRGAVARVSRRSARRTAKWRVRRRRARGAGAARRLRARATCPARRDRHAFRRVQAGAGERPRRTASARAAARARRAVAVARPRWRRDAVSAEWLRCQRPRRRPRTDATVRTARRRA